MKYEEWKKISGYESYEVSSYGRVRSLDRVNNVGKKLRGRILRLNIPKHGYPSVSLCRDGIQKRFTVHRLAAIAFFGESNLVVNHIDGDKKNNNISNLEFTTYSENAKHAYRTGLKKNNKGAGSPNYKGDIEVLSSDGDLVMTLKGEADIIANGFVRQNVYECANGNRRTHRGFKFRRVTK